MPAHVVEIKKADEMKRLVYAEVYAPNRPDTDNEFMVQSEIEKMAHNFMRAMKLDVVDVNHDQQNVENVCVVESFIARKGDPDFIEGAWVVGIHVNDDETWDKVMKGELNGFSMEALVRKETQDVEMEVPPVLKGETFSSDNHSHEFFVAYDADGAFRGGRTSVVEGHYHVIKRGTVTEESEGHAHRFSHIEQIEVKAAG